MPDSALATQFDDLDQQHEAASLGMWAFLATEVMFFGGMFLGYILYRSRYPQAFQLAAHELDRLLGSVNTLVLLTSSFSMALVVHYARLAERRKAIVALISTLLLGASFLIIKGFEYADKFAHHHVPGAGFHFELPADSTIAQGHVQLYFSFYFAMTGMHALHMVIGMGVMLFILAQFARGRMLGERSDFVEMTGLYWHFVDIIWVYLFPLFYLIHRT